LTVSSSTFTVYCILNAVPLNVYAWRNKAMVMYNLRRYNDALDNYERALEIDRNFADAQRGKELILKKIGKNNI
jgi:tetratricopeptide (TPR) repeat protein